MRAATSAPGSSPLELVVEEPLLGKAAVKSFLENVSISIS